MNTPTRTDDLLSLLDQAINEMEPEALAVQIDEMTDRQLQQFDPVRFGFIQSLGRKLQQQRESVSVLLFDKLKKALTELREDLQQSVVQGDKLLQVVREEFPDRETLAQQYHQQGDYQRLKKMVDGLYRKQLEAPSLFKSLIDDLSRMDSPAAALKSEMPDSDRASVSPSTPPAPPVPIETTSSDAPRELRALTPLRESWAKLNAEKLVMRSINEGPENAGPLNPHYLAIRSLSNMRDLSPHYLNRFVAYMETLLWLEKAAGKKPGSKRKKPTRK